MSIDNAFEINTIQELDSKYSNIPKNKNVVITINGCPDCGSKTMSFNVTTGLATCLSCKKKCPVL